MKKSNIFKTAVAMMMAIATLLFASPMMGQTKNWNSNVPPTVVNNDIVKIAAGAADTLRVPAGATVTITGDGEVDNTDKSIFIDISETATVVWEAVYKSTVATANGASVTLLGNGEFEVAKDAKITVVQNVNNFVAAINLNGGNVTVYGTISGTLSGTGTHYSRSVLSPATNTNAIIRIKGGILETPYQGISTLGANSTVIIEDGSILRNDPGNMTVITAKTIELTNGVVFATRSSISTKAQIMAQGGSTQLPVAHNITGDGIAINWRRAANQRVYDKGETTDLVAFNDEDATATAYWDVVGGKFGISNSINDIFIEVPEVTVKIPIFWNSDIAPTVVDGDVVTIVAGAADTLKIPEDATVTIISVSEVDNTDQSIFIEIPETSTVIWEAEYKSSVRPASGNAITILGGGEIEIAKDAIISMDVVSAAATPAAAIHIPSVGSVTLYGTIYAKGARTRGIMSSVTGSKTTIKIKGGLIDATHQGIQAQDTNSTVTVEDGGIVRVSLTADGNNAAISAATIAITDGVAFVARGATLAQIIGRTGSHQVANHTITDKGIAINWNRTANQRTYDKGETTHITVFHDAGDATAQWDIVDGKFGITNNKNDIFILNDSVIVEIPGVRTWGSAVPPTVADGYSVMILPGAADTLRVPENATVTIYSIGEVDNTDQSIFLDIPATSTVIWEAEYKSSVRPVVAGNAITILGGGELVIAEDAIISMDVISAAATPAAAININGGNELNGGTVTVYGTIYAKGARSRGIISAQTDTNATIKIKGGLIDATHQGIQANGANSTVTVEDGGIVKVSLTADGNNAAISAANIAITDGIAFVARGATLAQIIGRTGGHQVANHTITDKGIAINWNRPANQRIYEYGETTHLTVFHADGDATAQWDIADGKFGITNNKNDIFLQNDSVVVGISGVWNSAFPPTVVDGDVVTIAAGAAGTLEVPEDATVTIISEGEVDNINRSIFIDIPETSTVIWEAEYKITSMPVVGGNAITILGGGELEVAEEAIISIEAASTGTTPAAAINLNGGSVTLYGTIYARGVRTRGIASTQADTNAIIKIKGGLIDAGSQGIFADGANSTVTVEDGGIVRNAPTTEGNTAVISAANVAITDGLVYVARGGAALTQIISRTGGHQTANHTITDNGVAINWNRTANQRLYDHGDTTHLIVFHADGDAIAQWAIVDGKFGVTNNKNNIFLQNDSVTIRVAYMITFSVVNGNGTLVARVDGTTENFNSGVRIEQGKDVTFVATPAANFRVKEWKLDGTVVPDSTGNRLRLENIIAETTVTVEFEAVPSNIRPTVETDASLQTWVSNGVVNIKGLTIGQIYRIYSVNGTLVYQGIATSDIETLLMSLHRGIYIVHSGTQSVKFVW